MPWGWKLPVLCVLFATCGGGLVKDKDPGPATELPREGDNATLARPPPEPRRATLVRGVYRLLADGTMLLPKSRPTANDSSYAQEDEDEASSLLKCTDPFARMKPFYYAWTSFTLQFQVPLLVSAHKSFNRWSPVIFIFFIFWVFLGSFGTFACEVPQYPNMAVYYSLPSYLSVCGLNLAGGLALLHSGTVTACLARSRHIFVRKGTVFIRNKSYVACVGFFWTGALIAWSTFLFVSSSPPEPDFSNMRRDILGGFLPSCVACLVFNLVLCASGTPAAVSGDAWRAVRNRYQTLFKFFVAAFVNWMFGYAVAVTGFWELWALFVMLSFLYPIFLFCYIYNISRRVIYADPNCVKILEVDGDVLTIWNDPTKIRERNGTDKEKQPAEEKLQLDWFLVQPCDWFRESLTMGNEDHWKV